MFARRVSLSPQVRLVNLFYISVLQAEMLTRCIYHNRMQYMKIPPCWATHSPPLMTIIGKWSLRLEVYSDESDEDSKSVGPCHHVRATELTHSATGDDIDGEEFETATRRLKTHLGPVPSKASTGDSDRHHGSHDGCLLTITFILAGDPTRPMYWLSYRVSILLRSVGVARSSSRLC